MKQNEHFPKSDPARGLTQWRQSRRFGPRNETSHKVNRFQRPRQATGRVRTMRLLRISSRKLHRAVTGPDYWFSAFPAPEQGHRRFIPGGVPKYREEFGGLGRFIPDRQAFSRLD